MRMKAILKFRIEHIKKMWMEYFSKSLEQSPIKFMVAWGQCVLGDFFAIEIKQRKKPL